MAGDIVKIIFCHEEGNEVEDRPELGFGINFPFLAVPRFAAALAAIAMRGGHGRAVRVRLPPAELLVKGNVHTRVRDFDTDADGIGAVIGLASPRILPDGQAGAAGVEADAIEGAALINRPVAVDYDVSENAVVLCFPAADGAIGRKSFGVMDDDIERRERAATVDGGAFGGGEPMLRVDLADRSFRRWHFGAASPKPAGAFTWPECREWVRTLGERLLRLAGRLLSGRGSAHR